MRKDPSVLSKRTLFVFGCGGHGRSVVDVFLQRSPSAEILFVDEKARLGEKILGFPVLSLRPKGKKECFVAIGNNEKREEMWKQCQDLHLICIMAPSAYLAASSKIGRGVFIGNFAHIGPEATIADNTIINTGAIIEHEVVVGAHSHIGPRVAICGRCHIGSHVFIGAGAVVKDSVRIGSKVIVGAGAVVVKDLLEPGIYVGNPARVLSSEGNK